MTGDVWLCVDSLHPLTAGTIRCDAHPDADPGCSVALYAAQPGSQIDAADLAEARDTWQHITDQLRGQPSLADFEKWADDNETARAALRHRRLNVSLVDVTALRGQVVVDGLVIHPYYAARIAESRAATTGSTP